MDFIKFNGAVSGSVATKLMQNGGNPSVLRPWLDPETGKCYVTMTDERGKEYVRPIANADTTLRKDEWLQIDQTVMRIARSRLQVVADLLGAGLSYDVPGGMGTTVLQTERMGDINEAEISMDPIRRSQHDRPEFDLINLPLPVVHKDFEFSLRQIMASRRNGGGLDMTMVEMATRKCVEEVEKLTVGTSRTFTYGGGTIYGITNDPNANTQDITAPTETGWTPATLVAEVLSMKQKAAVDLMYGPYAIYLTSDWDPYLDADYSAQYPGVTLRDRLAKINNIRIVRSCDFLPATFKVILVQLTPDVIRMVTAMPITTIQWETHGGLLLHYKVAMIQVPQIRADKAGHSGIVIGAPA